MEFDQRKVLTLAGTLVLAGAVVVGGIYGPSAWKVLRNQTSGTDNKVVIQTPPIEDPSNKSPGTAQGKPQGTTPANPATTTTNPGSISAPPQGDVSGPKKYKEPDTKLMDLAPSVQGYFGESGLSEAAKSLAFGAAWNIHQYVDGYLFGPNNGPQMNEQDIKKYILFHKTLWDKQIKTESNASKAMALSSYIEVMLNRGMDAFDAKDKARIEQFHQEIHDFDTHLMRNDSSSKIYGATPFATKR